ncbi:hypothetical protein QEN19_002265 [Hanseniaspora menglaensis]
MSGSITNSKDKSASEKYQKISQLEHILKRPDTYIGSVEKQEEKMWTFDSETQCMIEREVSYVPGLLKIFDEILVNAADNKVRDPKMSKIDVTINSELNEISVLNDGHGIPIEMHEKEKIYIPEMIFGHLLTSSNYDDHEKKVTGGRNGYGAKLCNIFSTTFILETVDAKKGQKYIQKWENNMQKCNPPKITSYSNKNSYTKITFNPDLKRFNMVTLENDITSIMKRRVYDINGSVRDIKVTLNKENLKIKNFKNYVELYLKSLEKMKRIDAGEENVDENLSTPTIIYERLNDRWEIAFAVSDISFQQISFVNSIATTTGGTHVNYITDQLIKKIQGNLKKKNVKPFQIKNNMFIFVNCLIENPAFTSQTKEQLTTRVKDFGSKCDISDDFVKKVMKTNLADRIFEIADENANKTLKRSDGSKKNRLTEYPKLEDANKAGTREGHKCTLLLTEGDSAKSLAVAGLSIVGRDFYGCYPLRGKVLNVRDASADQVNKNQEIQAIKKIMGLQHMKKYSDVSSLRYGHLMIMTDQDYDGSHIKGLLINFLQTSFPGLLEIPGFLVEFITPIIKVTVTKPAKKSIQFFNIPEYQEWRENEGTQCTWSYKYYKGLGTSTQQEMREYFSNLDKHIKSFHALQADEDEIIELAFSKKKADERKEWLRLHEPGTFLDPTLDVIPIKEFINKELILFSLADNIRSIPNLMDGFKPVQRKVIYGALKHNVIRDMKVSTFAQYVSASTEYHHGDVSLVQTVVGLAQDFVGTNNIYMMMPKGAFGTRASGGKDAAAARYIFTHLNKLTSFIFHKDDSALLTYCQEDEKTIEPEWYAPVIPMILVNGGEGIGTGWSTNLPPFNPLDVVNNIYNLMDGKSMERMSPWYRGWNGISEKMDEEGTRYRMYGRIEQTGPTTIEITELPPTTWTSTIKEHLLAGLGGTEKVKPWIKDMEEQHGATIRFVITLTEEEFKKTKDIGFYERFKLVSPVHLTNLVCFDAKGKIRKFNDPREILQEYFEVRLELYQKRKDYLVGHLQSIIDKLSFQSKFLNLVITGELKVGNKKKSVLSDELEDLGFPRINKKGETFFGKIEKDVDMDTAEDVQEAVNINPFAGEDENNSAENLVINSSDEKYGTFDYLLNMKLWSLTYEKYDALLKEIQNKEADLLVLKSKTHKDLWKEDLDEFVKQYDKFIAYDTEARSNTIPDKATKSGKKGKKATTSKKSSAKLKGDTAEFNSVLIKQEVNEKTILKEAKLRGKKSLSPVPIKKENEAFDTTSSSLTSSTTAAAIEPASEDISSKPKYQTKLPKTIIKSESSTQPLNKKDEDSEGDIKVVKKAKISTQKSKPTAVAKKIISLPKKVTSKVVVEENDEENSSSDSDFEITDLPPKRSTTRRAISKPVNYETPFSDEEKSSESESSDEDDEFIP